MNEVREGLATKEVGALRIVEAREEWVGSEKRTIKMSDGQQEFAAKIFLEKDRDGQNIKKVPQKAQSEFKAYQDFRLSALREYVPQPYFLLRNEQGEVIGYALEWRDGTALTHLLPARVLDRNDIDKLQEAFESFDNSKLLPDDDMMQEGNIMVDPTSSGDARPRLWIAECEKYRWKNRNYKEAVKTQMDYLRENFIRR